jgi:hypothetical protein
MAPDGAAGSPPREEERIHASGASPIDELMRRICLRALVKTLGSGVNVSTPAIPLTYQSFKPTFGSRRYASAHGPISV